MIKKLPWLRHLKKTAPEVPVQTPILCDAMSNGEGWWPDSPRKKLIRKLILEKADEVSRREGIDRREFLASSCGTATALYMINLVNGCSSGKDQAPNNNIAGQSGGGSGGSGGGSSGAGGSGGGSSGSGGMGAGSSGMGGGGGGMNGGSGAGGGGGGTGGFNIPDCAMEDPEIADAALGNGGNELIIDMQSHFANTETNPTGASFLQSFVGQINRSRYPWLVRTEGCETMMSGTACFNRLEYVNQIMMGSDTTIGVLSGISYSLGASGGDQDALFAVLTNTDLIDGVNKLEADFPRRMLSHAMVMPNDRLDVQLAMMDRLSNQYTNWKTYPPWTGTFSTGVGYWLDDPAVGGAMIQRGIDLGSPIFCIHKGFPLSSFSPVYTDPKDVGPAALMFPNAYFVIYHSAFEHGLAAGDSTSPAVMSDVGWGPGVGQWPEGPYNEDYEDDMAMATANTPGSYPLNRGVNSLIWSLRKAGIGPNGTSTNGGPTTNVYAECGGVWPNLMLGRQEEAMHYWGKLLKYIGEDRIVWGTDCLWFGSPQPVIEAFRAFEISQEFQDRYGYPALTKERKAKILGINAALLQNVRLGGTAAEIKTFCHDEYVTAQNLRQKKELDEEWGRRRDMVFAYNKAPRTRREFLQLQAEEHREKVLWSGRFPNRVKI